MYSPRRVPCPVEPPEVQNTVRVMKSIQLDIPNVNTAVKNIRVVDLMASVPGGTTYWNHVRFQGFRIWSGTNLVVTDFNGSAPTPVLRVDCENVGANQPSISWTDTGTSGQQRPSIAFQPALGLQSEWFVVASTQTLFSVRILNATATPVTFSDVTVQAVVELLSPNLS